MKQVGIVGGSGYTGSELLRILSRHNGVDVSFITSRANAGTRVDQLYPHLRGICDLEFSDPGADEIAQCDLVFFATPNGTAMKSANELLDKGVKIVDLSADFRLKDRQVWEHWYGQTHAAAELLESAVYGLPEMHRDEIASAALVANPGCYPTCIQLGFLPLLEAGLVNPETLIADGKSGISGAGRGASTGNLLAENSDSFRAYGVPGHRHLPEIEQGLQMATGKPVGLTFTAHLLPIIRGIHATLYMDLLGDGIDDSELQQLFETRYAEEIFVDVMPAGSHPETRSVKGINTCRLAVHRPQQRNRIVVLAVEDNLVKGAAGQAVQNMNLMLGLPEVSGLDLPVMVP